LLASTGGPSALCACAVLRRSRDTARTALPAVLIRSDGRQSLAGLLLGRAQLTAAPLCSPAPRCREGLPILGMEQEVMEAVSQSDVVVLCGETGCGKTTQARAAPPSLPAAAARRQQAGHVDWAVRGARVPRRAHTPAPRRLPPCPPADALCRVPPYRHLPRRFLSSCTRPATAAACSRSARGRWG
jgi:hypothetical protein